MRTGKWRKSRRARYSARLHAVRTRATRTARSTRPDPAGSSVRIPQPLHELVDVGAAIAEGLPDVDDVLAGAVDEFDPARDIALFEDQDRPIVWIRTR